MSRSYLRLSAAALALVAGGAALHAQTSVTSGSFVIRLTSSDSKAMAGAKVTIVSGQISRTAVSDTEGQVRFGLLTPGVYKITVSKAGYQSVAQSQSIRTNETTFVNFSKVPLEQSTVVDVVASTAPAVDVTSATTSTTTTGEMLSMLPVGRSLFSAATMAPGVVADTNSGGMSISGASGIENAYVLDGLTTNNARNGSAGQQLAPEFVDQVEIQTGGFKPEFSALGGVVNIVSKSGTNTTMGSLALTTNMPGVEARPFPGFDYSAIGAGVTTGRQTRSTSRQEVVFTLSGPIVKDKLFYFVGSNSYAQTLPGSAGINNNIEGKILKNSDQKRDFINAYLKLDYYASQNQHFTLGVQRTNNVFDGGNIYPTYGDRNSGIGNKSNYTAWTLNYDWTISSNLFLTAKVGENNDTYSDTLTNNEMYVVDRVRLFYNDPAKPGNINYLRGGGGYADKLNDSNVKQYRVDLSWFVGDHNIKVGYQKSDSTFEEISGYSGNPSAITPYLEGANGPVAVSYPSAPYLYIRKDWFSPTQDAVRVRWYGQNAKVKSKFQAFYVQDTWEFVQGLRATFGARFEGQEHLDANGKTFFDFKSLTKHWQPRLSLIWDARGDQRTKVSFNVAKYYEQIPLQPTMRQGGKEYYLDNFYSANKFKYDRPTGNWSFVAGAQPDDIVDYAVNFAAPPQMDDLRLPAKMEYQAGIAHTFAKGDFLGHLLEGWTAQLNFRFRKVLDVMEDTVITDYDGEYTNLSAGANAQEFGYAIMWNPTPGKVSWTDKNGVKVTANWTPYPEASNVSRIWELSLNKTTERYTLNFNYTMARLTGNYEGLASGSNGQLDANITASWDYWPYVGTGTLPGERRHALKAQGVYSWTVFNNRLSMGVQAYYQSGAPRTFWTNGDPDGLPDIGSYGDAIPKGRKLGDQGTQPGQTNVDMSLEYEVKLGGKFRVAPKFEIYNLANTRKITNYNDMIHDASGKENPLFNLANAKRFGRNYRFTVGLRF